MTIRLRTAFFIILGILLLWFLYIEREILTPFILAGIFAYILNPIVNFLSRYIKLPRTLSVVIIYLILLGGIGWISFSLSHRIISESSQFERFVNNFVSNATLEARNLPDWTQPLIIESLNSLNKSKVIALSPSLLAFFPEAISRLVSFVIFVFSAFYFLKEGRGIVDRFLNFIPGNYRVEVEILLRKSNAVLGGYLRGQILMIILMSSVFFIILSVFNVKFALILAIFSGIAEIIPFIGPIVATSLAGILAFATGSSAFSLTPLYTTLGVVLSYIIARQIQDYVVLPQVMGKITKLHPLIILFAVIAGGHSLGFFGLILAVPIAGVIRVLLEYFFDKVK